MTTLNDFYTFQATPFTKSIAAQHLFPSRGHCEIQGRLAFAVQERLPTLITGDVGTGKSTALRAFAHSLDRNIYAVAYLSNPHLTPATLYRQILFQLQTEPSYGFIQLLPQLHSTFSDMTRKGRFILLIIDEAHLLSPDILEQLRFLLNDDMDSASPLTKPYISASPFAIISLLLTLKKLPGISSTNSGLPVVKTKSLAMGLLVLFMTTPKGSLVKSTIFVAGRFFSAHLNASKFSMMPISSG